MSTRRSPNGSQGLSEGVLTSFTDRHGDLHRIVSLPARDTTGGKGGRILVGGQLLVDYWQGHGLRCLCVMKPGDPDTECHARAIVREYARDLATRTTPLCRCVRPEELAPNGNGSGTRVSSV